MPEPKPAPFRGGICILSHSHPDFSKGGGEIAAMNQFTALRAAGHRVVMVSASEPASHYATSRPVETILRHGEDAYFYNFAGMTDDRLAWADHQQRRLLVEFLAGLDCAVYHLHHYWRVGTDLIAELMEARPDATFVLTLHEMLAICLNRGQMVMTRSNELCRRESLMRCLACFPEQSLERFAFRKATLLSTLRRFDTLLYPSDFIRARYEDWGLVGPRAAVVENYLGDAMHDAARPGRAPPGATATHIGFFGLPSAFKGLDVLVRALPLALRARPDLTLTVYGADRADALRGFPALEPLVDALGPALTFAGRYDSADAVALMRGVGWVVVPSIWWENSPVVIQEARHAGTPLIVSDIGGMAEKVQEGVDGLHFRRGSGVDLARALVEAADPALRARLAASIRPVIDRTSFLAALGAAYQPRPRAS
jgi:glycosyltransferase involved in cell wall biosynthesis